MTEMLVELVLCPVTFTGAAKGSDRNNNLLTVSIIGENDIRDSGPYNEYLSPVPRHVVISGFHCN